MIEYDAHEPGTWRDAALHFRAENERLTAELAAVTAERDAEIARLREQLALSEAVVRDGCEAHVSALSQLTAEIARLREALEDMVYQFAYSRTQDGEVIISTGGLSALEDAFETLGWPDPMRAALAARGGEVAE